MVPKIPSPPNPVPVDSPTPPPAIAAHGHAEQKAPPFAWLDGLLRPASVVSGPLGPLWRWSERGLVAVALLFVTYVCWQHALHASLSVDGVRYYWLDDDQMISMRYARNLVEGHGLTWNPGERIEGYTNFGWTLVLAAVHLLRLPLQQNALVVQTLTWLFCLATVLLSRRLLLQLLEGRTVLATLALTGALVTCQDIVGWSAGGFETSLITTVHLLVMTRIFDPRSRLTPTLLLLATIPLIRGDGVVLWGTEVVALLVTRGVRRRLLVAAALTLLPAFGHLLFRHGYYGQWTPNTYLLKTVGLDHRLLRGAEYFSRFAHRYSVALALAALPLIWKAPNWRRCALLGLNLTLAGLYVLTVGGDNFPGSRFFAHVLPELFILAAVAITRLASHPPLSLAAAAAFCWRTAQPLRWDAIAPISGNGDPYLQVPVAAMLSRYASPQASVGVIAAGIVPYFTGLRSHDLLGKSDRHIAASPYHPRAAIGHGKVDPAYSFGQVRPDYVVSYRAGSFPYAVAYQRRIGQLPAGPFDYVAELLGSPEFTANYLRQPIGTHYLSNVTEIYVERHSAELARSRQWRDLPIAP